MLLAAIFFAGPAVEVEAKIEIELARQEVLPVKATLESIVALVGGVARASELVGVVPLVATEAELENTC